MPAGSMALSAGSALSAARSAGVQVAAPEEALADGVAVAPPPPELELPQPTATATIATTSTASTATATVPRRRFEEETGDIVTPCLSAATGLVAPAVLRAQRLTSARPYVRALSAKGTRSMRDEMTATVDAMTGGERACGGSPGSARATESARYSAASAALKQQNVTARGSSCAASQPATAPTAAAHASALG